MVTKKLVLKSAGVLCCIGLLFLAGRLCAASDPTAKPDEASSADKPAAWSELSPNRAAESIPQDKSKDELSKGLMKQFAIATFFVIVLGMGVYYFSKKLVPRLTTSQGKNISIIETIHLGPHKKLHVLEVGGNQKLLIGSTNETITILADVTGALSELFDPNVPSE